MNAKQRRRDDLLLWRYNENWRATPQKLSNSLSVEGLPDHKVPRRLRKALTEFRKLRQDARTAACKRFIEAA